MEKNQAVKFVTGKGKIFVPGEENGEPCEKQLELAENGMVNSAGSGFICCIGDCR